MDHKAQANGVLEDLARLVGLTSLQLDDQDACYLSFDEQTIVSFNLDSRMGDMVLWSMVGEIAVDDHALLREMLHANLAGRGTRGATLSVDPATGGAVLSLRLPIEGLRAPLLEQRLKDFVTTVEEWTGRLAQPGVPSRRQGDDSQPFPEMAIRV